jgi:hypothetical protein
VLSVGEVQYASLLHPHGICVPFLMSSLPIGGGEKVKSFLLFPLKEISLSLV